METDRKKNCPNFGIFTLNLRFGLADDGSNSWKFRQKTFPYLIKKFQTDFLCFQEANNFQIDFLKKLMAGLGPYSTIGQREDAPPFWQDNIIFHHRRWKCIKKERFFLSHTPSVPSRLPKSQWPRQCTIGIFKHGSFDMACATTHFDFDADVQKQSARIIMKRIENLAGSLPAVITGDFNNIPFSPAYNIFTGQNSNIESNAIPDVKNDRGNYFKDAFLNSHPATHHGFTGSMAGDHIDWILYKGGGIACRNFGAFFERINDIYPSDHFPIHASFGKKK